MALIRPILSIGYRLPRDGDLSKQIAPPYDVIDQQAKSRLLQASEHNIVAIDLPHLPAKTVGPDETYMRAGQVYRDWRRAGVLQQRHKPAVFAYRQTFNATIPGDPSGNGQRDAPAQNSTSGASAQTIRRLGLLANVAVQPLGREQTGHGSRAGAIYPHEQTFGEPKLDRLKLMRATKTQLSPIFAMHWDPESRISNLLAEVLHREPTCHGTTCNDGVLHELWAIEEADHIDALTCALAHKDIFIADGHHRYTTALNYKQEHEQELGELPADHPANFCMFVLVAMQDPGMMVLPTHRVLGGMVDFTFAKLVSAARGQLNFRPFPGDLTALERALRDFGPHAMGLYHPADTQGPLHMVTPVDGDPLSKQFPQRSKAWRQLNVALVQHLVVEQICLPHFAPAGAPADQIQWKFPHELDELKDLTENGGYQLGLILQPTPLGAVREVSEAGELMPPKSTFFYPKLATGFVINPLAPPNVDI